MPDLETPTEGRSQFLLTCDSVDVVLIDRETLRQLNRALIEALEGFQECELWQEFVYTAQRYLQESSETAYCQVEELERPINSALLFLESWAEKFPDVLSLSTHTISESQKVLYSILALSDMGGGDD
ncbi:hypothetical protein QUB56_23445 [Microcoleus sp. AR_TQ3_B6]|uniref:hypothetical protein n=1 Tax=Microcoleus sp. AR_TQ3_B6 TaxID=3055284 RepID=UPI002FD55143